MRDVDDIEEVVAAAQARALLSDGGVVHYYPRHEQGSRDPSERCEWCGLSFVEMIKEPATTSMYTSVGHVRPGKIRCDGRDHR